MEHLHDLHRANVDKIEQKAKRLHEEDKAKVDAIEQKAKHLREEYKANVNTIAQYAAAGGYESYAECLRKKHGASIHEVGKGAARGGLLMRSYAERLRVEGAHIHGMAVGAALAGDIEYAEELRKAGTRVDGIAGGASSSGHQFYAEYLRVEHHASANVITAGEAMGGYEPNIEHFLTTLGITIKLIVQTAAGNRHHAYVERLYVKHKVDIDSIARGVWRSDDVTNPIIALRTLALLQNDTYRHALASALNKLGLSYDIMALVPQAEHIRQNMQRYQFNFDQALAYTKPEIRELLFASPIPLIDPLKCLVAEYLEPLRPADATTLNAVHKSIPMSTFLRIIESYQSTSTSQHPARSSFTGSIAIQKLRSLVSRKESVTKIEIEKAIGGTRLGFFKAPDNTMPVQGTDKVIQALGREFKLT